MHTPPFLSVIIPVYNAEKYLAKTLESLHEQTLQEVEFLLINDGSTDSSATICHAFTEKDPRFHLFEKENGGPSAARNLGITQAKGKWIGFFDSDDLLLEKEGLARLCDILKDTPCDCLRFDYKAIDENDNVLWDESVRRPRKATCCHTPLPLDLFVQEVIRSDFFSWLLVVRREVIDTHAITFPIEYNFIEDIHWLIRLLPHLNSAIYLPYPLYGYRKLSNSLSYRKSTKERCEHFCQALSCALTYEAERSKQEDTSKAYLHIAYHLYHTILSLLGCCTLSEQRAIIEGQQFKQQQQRLAQLSQKTDSSLSCLDQLSFRSPIAAAAWVHFKEQAKEQLYHVYTHTIKRLQ